MSSSSQLSSHRCVLPPGREVSSCGQSVWDANGPCQRVLPRNAWDVFATRAVEGGGGWAVYEPSPSGLWAVERDGTLRPAFSCNRVLLVWSDACVRRCDFSLPSTGKSSNSSSSSSTAAGFCCSLAGSALEESWTTAFVVFADPCAAPDMVCDVPEEVSLRCE